MSAKYEPVVKMNYNHALSLYFKISERWSIQEKT